MTPKAKLQRRAFLQGLGTSLALPLLDIAQPARAASSAAPPLRTAFLFIPNGAIMEHWTPGKTGDQFDLPSILKPLEAFRKDMLVLSGLAHDKARANGDGAGDHARNVAAFLTASQPFKTAGADIRAGISIDQLIASRIGRNTRFPSLELGLEGGRLSGSCDSGYSCAYSSNVSWRTPTTPVPKEVNPRAVFERLFGSHDDEQNAESRARRRRYQQSILDFVLDDARRLQRDLGVRDRQKVDEYLASVREIERRIELVERSEAIDPPEDFDVPRGVPKEFAQHARLMADMMVLAFQTDLTRTTTFMLGNAGSNRSYRELEISEGHHYLSHHRNDADKVEKIRRINLFHTQQLAYFLQRLKETPDGEEGSLLDHSLIVYGSGIGDGNRHTHHDLPVLLLGGGNGTIKTGRHVQYPKDTPLANLFLGILDRVGIETDEFGDSTGRLPNLT